VNHYEVLGVRSDADASAIRRAYLDAARRHHPDFHTDADAATRARNAQRMQAVNEAWAVLSDAGARRAYDAELARISDPGVARRAARERGGRDDLPPGKGWTPRAGDDGWMTDFEAWADERDDLAPEDRSVGRGVVTVLPVALFAFSVVAAFVGLALGNRGLAAVGFVALVVSAGMFLLLPMFEMSRGRRRP
jgi:curved DNA-binding protein CbpA